MAQNRFFKKILNKMNVDINSKSVSLSNYPTKQEVNPPRNPVFPLNFKQSADILELPQDKNKNKYLLVLMDYKRYVAVEPLKKIDSITVLRALKKIWNDVNNPLKIPSIFQADNGSEFKGAVQQYLKYKTKIVYTKAYRKRQNALVETFNGLMGRVIGYFENKKQLETDKPSNDWVTIAQNVAKKYNESQKNKLIEYRKFIKNHRSAKCKNDSCNLLRYGQKVRIPLETPINPETKEKLKGKFRSNDIRFNPKTYTINKVVLLPNQPPLYMVNQKSKVAYTKSQLYIIPENEVDDIEDNELEDGLFIVEDFIKKRNNAGRVQFLVKWKNYPHSENTWEFRTKLIKDLGNARVIQLEENMFYDEDED